MGDAAAAAGRGGVGVASSPGVNDSKCRDPLASLQLLFSPGNLTVHITWDRNQSWQHLQQWTVTGFKCPAPAMLTL